MNIFTTFATARRNGITPSSLHGLITILHQPGITAMRLSEALGCSTANITGLVDKLERDGWVERVRAKNDRRKVFLMPSTKAAEAFQEAP